MNDWSLPPLSMGEFAPAFHAATRANPKFHFSTLAGRYVLLGFVPAEAQVRTAALHDVERIRSRLDDTNLTAFLVSSEHEAASVAEDRVPGLRWFFDPDGSVGRLFAGRSACGHVPAWFLFDPGLRLMASAPLESFDGMAQAILSLPPPAQHTGVAQIAPVAIVPRVFEPDFCRRLIAAYDAEGGHLSGVMRDVGGRTVGVLDDMKRRRDVEIRDADFQRDVVQRLERRLSPMVRRVFQFNPTRLERYLVACYNAEEGGFFKPHRDNETFGTAHRRFAVSINLNAEDYEGGDLRFPEFGPRTYRPPTGGAVVFSCSLQHEATPVTSGRRYAFLPFLYDEAGQVIRDQNRALLDSGSAAGT